MKKEIYRVGGCVRDEIMGVPYNDIDHVITGCTEEDMLKMRFKKVGADFPVFLHPETGEEWALARRERSTGPGYNDFTVEFDPSVTIVEDLKRRDFTMNAIAWNVNTGEYVDPYNGMDDIRDGIISVVDHDAFIEDPVRILRMARFTARFPWMRVEEDTITTAKEYGNLAGATPERVWKELEKALMTVKPSNFFRTLHLIGHLELWFPEIAALIGVPQTVKWHMEGDAFEHTMMVLDSAAKHREDVLVRFACLVHDLGKGITPKHKLPSHPGHEAAGVPLVDRMCDRLKAPSNFRFAGCYSARYHMHVHKVEEITPKKLVNVYEDIKHNFKLVDIITRTAFHDNEGKLPYRPYDDKHLLFYAIMAEARDNDKMSNHFSIEELKQMRPDIIQQKRRQILINAIRNIK